MSSSVLIRLLLLLAGCCHDAAAEKIGDILSVCYEIFRTLNINKEGSAQSVMGLLFLNVLTTTQFID